MLCFCKPGDVAGIGWERSECTPPPPGQAPKGRVYFTYGGQRLCPILEDVAGGMWPLVHIQKKVGLFLFHLYFILYFISSTILSISIAITNLH